MIEASGLYAIDPEVRSFASDVQYSSANVRGIAVNRYLVNTEGTALRNGYTAYASNIDVGGQAPDGMGISRGNGSTARTSAALESWPAFRKRVVDDLKSIEALRTAPVVSAEDYHGPVLFSGDAASDLFSRLFVSNVEASRPEMGTTARTTGQYTSSFHARVLPEFFSVIDNPLEKSFAGQQLIGAYDFDDEGVPAQSVPVVVAGKLENYLIGRTPIRDFPESNGHGRAAVGQAPRSESAVVLFQSKAPLTGDAIHARLLSMARDQGRDVYEVETVGGDLAPGSSTSYIPTAPASSSAALSLTSSTTAACAPTLSLPGDDYINNSLGTIPQTIVAPSLLFDDIGVKPPPSSSRSSPTTRRHRPRLPRPQTKRSLVQPHQIRLRIRVRNMNAVRNPVRSSAVAVLWIDSHPVSGRPGKLNHLCRRKPPQQIILQLHCVRWIQERSNLHAPSACGI